MSKVLAGCSCSMELLRAFKVSSENAMSPLCWSYKRKEKEREKRFRCRGKWLGVTLTRIQSREQNKRKDERARKYKRNEKEV